MYYVDYNLKVVTQKKVFLASLFVLIVLYNKSFICKNVCPNTPKKKSDESVFVCVFRRLALPHQSCNGGVKDAV